MGKYCERCATKRHLNDRGGNYCTDCDWHGWSRGGSSLHIGHLPGRKQVCLYTIEGTTIRTHAFFKNEERARTVMWLIDSLVAPLAREQKR